MSDQPALVPEAPPSIEDVSVLSLREIHEGMHPPLDAGFVESIRRYGIMQTPLVRKTANHEYAVIDGRRRVAAYRQIEGDDALIDVCVVWSECSPDVLALMLNEQRTANPVSDLAAIEELARKGASLEEIAAATGMKRATVEKRMRLGALSLNWRRQFDEGKLTAGVAQQLAALDEETQGQLFIHYAETGRITHADIAEMKYARAQEDAAVQPATMFAVPEATQVSESLDNPEGGEDFYLWAQKAIAQILMAAPTDAPRSARDALGFAATVFSDIAEAQGVAFLEDDERVDVSDVAPIDDTPYDEEPEEIHEYRPSEDLVGVAVPF